LRERIKLFNLTRWFFLRSRISSK